MPAPRRAARARRRRPRDRRAVPAARTRRGAADHLRATLLIDLGRAEALAGQPTAVARLRAAVALLDQPQERARALAQLGQALYSAGDNPAAASAFDEGLRVLGGADAVLEEELTAGYLGAARLDFRTREAALTRFKDLLAGSTEATTPAQRELLSQRALEHAMLGSASADDVVGLIRRAQDGDRMLREVSSDAVAYAGAAAALLFCDALHDVESTTTAGLEDARRRGSVVGFALMSAIRGASRYLRGDIAGALGDLEGGIERVPIMVLVQPFAHGWTALAHIERGELEEAERLVGAPADEEDRHFTYNWALFARGRLALASGHPARALEDLLECGRRQIAIPAPSPAVLPWRSEAAIAALKLERTAFAQELAEEELHLARAVDALREGLEASHHYGATTLANFARAELVAAGARPRRPAMRGADALTPSELRVSELAEQGLTNREIAQALFISTKTVEFHLRNAYMKLRIRSRNELGGVLRGGETSASATVSPEPGSPPPATPLGAPQARP